MPRPPDGWGPSFDLRKGCAVQNQTWTGSWPLVHHWRHAVMTGTGVQVPPPLYQIQLVKTKNADTLCYFRPWNWWRVIFDAKACGSIFELKRFLGVLVGCISQIHLDLVKNVLYNKMFVLCISLIFIIKYETKSKLFSKERNLITCRTKSMVELNKRMDRVGPDLISN